MRSYTIQKNASPIVNFAADYDVWGHQVVDQRFTAKFSDLEIGLDYFGARFYDPQLGIWISQDPAHQFLNPYSYGYLPNMMVDKDGRFLGWDDAIVSGIGAVVGFTAYALDHKGKFSWGKAVAYAAVGAAIAETGYLTAGAAAGAYTAATTAATASGVTSVGSGALAGALGTTGTGFVTAGSVMGEAAGAGLVAAGTSASLGAATAGGLVGGAVTGGLNAWAFGGTASGKGLFGGSASQIGYGLVFGGAGGAFAGAAAYGLGSYVNTAASYSAKILGDGGVVGNFLGKGVQSLAYYGASEYGTSYVMYENYKNPVTQVTPCQPSIDNPDACNNPTHSNNPSTSNTMINPYDDNGPVNNSKPTSNGSIPSSVQNGLQNSWPYIQQFGTFLNSNEPMWKAYNDNL